MIKKKFKIILLMLFIGLLQNLLSVPVAKEKDKTITLFNQKWNDEYFYLRNFDDTDTQSYLKAENQYFNRKGKTFKKLQDQIYKEMKSRIEEDEISVPYKHGKWVYYYQNIKNKAYGLHYRIDSETNQKEILLDENKLAKGKNFFSLGLFTLNQRQDILAYTVDNDGNEDYILYIKDLQTNKILKDRLYSVDEIVWIKNKASFLYTVHNNAFQSYRLFLHNLGEDPVKDKLLLEENDAAFNLSVYSSRSEEYAMIVSSSKTSCKAWCISLTNKQDSLTTIWTLKKGTEFYPDHFQGIFYSLTNENCPNYKYVQYDLSDPENYKEVYRPEENDQLLEVLHFSDYLVISERSKGVKRLRIVDRSTRDTTIPFEGIKSLTLSLGVNLDSKSDSLRFDFESNTIPLTVYQMNMRTKSLQVLKKYSPKGNFKQDDYEENTIFAVNSDSVKIPIDIVYKKSLYKEKMPCLLYCYGSYGDSEDPYFSSLRISLLDRGWVYADAHIRGGGEFGKEWHDQGKLLNRKHTFQDFILCAETLIEKSITDSSLLVINGGSAGGMIMGAVTNMRPGLFKAVVADVPFVDVLNTMMDSTMALTMPEYEEWGNPYEKEYFDYIRSYSPYDNIRFENFPHMLINAGLNDTRVKYWEPLKWTAKLRKYNQGTNLLLLKMKNNEGHSGSGDRYESIKDVAFMYSFMIWSLNH